MVLQPGAVDNSAAVIIHALTRNSKQDTLAGAIADLENEYCMGSPRGYARNDHAPEIPESHGR